MIQPEIAYLNRVVQDMIDICGGLSEKLSQDKFSQVIKYNILRGDKNVYGENYYLEKLLNLVEGDMLSAKEALSHIISKIADYQRLILGVSETYISTRDPKVDDILNKYGTTEEMRYAVSKINFHVDIPENIEYPDLPELHLYRA
jgi:hypothetical protein